MNKHQEAYGRIIDSSDLKIHVENGLPMNQDTKDVLLVQELVDKATPKKPLFEDIGNIRHHKCPDCEKTICHEVTGAVKTFSTKHNFCSKCGQAIDWSKSE